MSKLCPISFFKLVNGFKKFGYIGPYSGGKHLYMIKGNKRITIPNLHRQNISVDLLKRLLKRAAISREEWINKI